MWWMLASKIARPARHRGTHKVDQISFTEAQVSAREHMPMDGLRAVCARIYAHLCMCARPTIIVDSCVTQYTMYVSIAPHKLQRTHCEGEIPSVVDEPVKPCRPGPPLLAPRVRAMQTT